MNIIKNSTIVTLSWKKIPRSLLASIWAPNTPKSVIETLASQKVYDTSCLGNLLVYLFLMP